MILTKDNYFSKESDALYMSNSQYNSFIGSGIYPGCESMALAKLRGEWVDEPNIAFQIGSFCDAHFEHTLPEFKFLNNDMFTLKGELKAPFKLAEEMIARAESDEFFMDFMNGQKQVIMTGVMFNVPWKIKIDSYHPGRCLVDLKTTKSIRERVWNGNMKVNFIEAGGYCQQLAIYREIVRINTGELLPAFIAAISKENPIDIEIIEVPVLEMDMALEQVRMNIDHVMAVKNHDIPSTPCGKCAYCVLNKKLSSILSFYDL
jgi:hypothetical protein